MKIFISIFVFLSQVYCYEGRAGSVDPPPPLADVALNKNDISNLEDQALKGSGDAARKLSLHYMMATSNRSEALYWALISAENGDANGAYLAGFMLREGKSQRDRERALFWLRSAANNGVNRAVELMKENP